MTKPKRRILKVIRKSVLTGRAVWVSHNRTYRACRLGYKAACKHEAMRIRLWGRAINSRKKNVLRLLGDLTADLPIIGDVVQEKRDAAKALNEIADGEPVCDKNFYEHVMEEKRLRDILTDKKR